MGGRERYWPCGLFLAYYRELMHVALLVVLSVSVATAPVVPVLECGQALSGAPETEPTEESCGCCCANALSCRCGCCDDDARESHGAPRAEQGCGCGQRTPQNHDEPRAGSGGAEVRLAAGVFAARHEGQQKRGITRTLQIPRKYPHPEVRPPLLI